MLNFDSTFFEDEVRYGFYVPSMTKRAWAVELEVLAEVDRICRKHHITYFADWGTLLGVVRHKGFIPWDDDMDIVMHRNEYEKFAAVAKDELPAGFYISDFETNENSWKFLVNITSYSRMCFEPEYLDKYYGFPYMAGLDVFLLDNVPEDAEEEKNWKTLIKHIIGVADSMENGSLNGRHLETALCQIETLCQVRLLREGDMYQRKLQLYKLAKREFSKYNYKETPEITQLMPLGLYENRKLPADYYKEAIRMPFEHVDISVPLTYTSLLQTKYPGYMSVSMNGGAHNYPFYISQKKSLGTDLDFVPKYVFSEAHLKKNRAIAGVSLKSAVRTFLDYLNAVSPHLDTADLQSTRALLVDLQEKMILLGTSIEQAKGMEQSIVKLLEQCCEQLYLFHELLDEAERYVLMELFEQLNDTLTSAVLNRTEAVFLPYKSSYWKSMESVWQAAVDDPTCDVYVIPIPYYYKKYDGTFLDMHYEGADFPAHVRITSYDAFDFSLHQPDMIFIQNPYDEYNMALSVPPFFYSSNLKNYTDKLVYIPYFKLAEFDADNYRACYNMQYYCTMPGVVQADLVIVQSEQMKQRYVEKLTEFAGEATKEIWEEKIVGLGTPLTNVPESTAAIPAGWETDKPRLLYYTCLGALVDAGTEMIEKLMDSLLLLKKNSEEITLVWHIDPMIFSCQEKLAPDLYSALQRLIQQFKQEHWGIFDESADEAKLVHLCNAYYGDASPLALVFERAGKPVMLQNVMIKNAGLVK